MNTLYLNCGVPFVGEKTAIPSKADYLLMAAEKEGLTCVKRYDPNVRQEYVLNIQPYCDAYQGMNFAQGIKWTGSWEIDCICNRERMQFYWDKVDTVFMCNRIGFETKRKDFVYLYEACWPEFYDYQVESEYDLVQCGNMGDLYYYKDFGLDHISPEADIYFERRRIYEMLRRGYKVKYMGSNYPIREHLKNLAKAKVQFIQSMQVLGENEIAQRFWESLPIGPVLTSYSPTLEDIDLVEGKDYLCFRNDKDLVDKLDELLNVDWYRKSIWQNGRKKAFEKHTYANRLHQLLDYLKQYGFKY